MYKLIDSSSFFSQDDLQVKVLDLSNTSELVKSAADNRIVEFTKDIKPEPGKMYLHINAMGAGEYYGANRNGDYFPEEILKQYYKTFEQFGHVFRHHVNKDPAKSIGKVLFSIYNERMHRVELIVEVNQELAKDLEERIARGDYPATSMACKTPYDTCSICGNQARSRQEYCAHLSTQLGCMLPNGQKVMAINDGPLKFFDISIVTVPADPSSYILEKVAGYAGPVTSSAELAEREGLVLRSEDNVKEAAFDKLSELIKIIDSNVGYAGPLDNILARIKDPADSIMDALAALPFHDMLNGMAELGICPSVKFLCKYIAKKNGRPELGDYAASMMSQVPFQRNMVVQALDRLNPIEAPARVHVIRILRPFVEGSSILPEFVEKRASDIGYAPLNYNFQERPQPAPAPAPLTGLNAMAENISKNPLLHALLVIGTTAIATRLLLNSIIEKKLNERMQKNQAKIVIVKSAAWQSYVAGVSTIGSYGLAKSLKNSPEIGAGMPGRDMLQSHPILGAAFLGGATKGFLPKVIQKVAEAGDQQEVHTIDPVSSFVTRALKSTETKIGGTAALANSIYSKIIQPKRLKSNNDS